MEETKQVTAEIVDEEFTLQLVNNTFSEFEAQFAKIKEESDNTVFNYEDKADNKLARSHVRLLREMKTPIKEAKTNAKKPLDDCGKALITMEKKYLSQIDDMIEVHNAPLKAIKDREEKRKADLIERVQQIVTSGQKEYLNSTETSEMLEGLKKLSIEEDLEEYQEVANAELEKAIALVASKHDVLFKNEENAKELERLRIENAEKDRKIREDQIARQSAEKAEFEKKQAIENADREKRDTAERVEREKREASEKVDRDKKEAAERAEHEKNYAIQAEKDRQAREKAEQDQKDQEAQRAEQARQANTDHRKRINNGALQSIIDLGFSREQGVTIVIAIVKGNIENVSIKY